MDHDNSNNFENPSEHPEDGQSQPEQDVPRSPIRPHHPQQATTHNEKVSTRPFKPVAPTDSLAEANTPERELIQKSEAALENLRQKMSAVAEQFSKGEINEAQFNAIYRRYSEQREITERLLERDPQSDAWQQVVQEGHTGFLMSYFAAKIISYGIYRVQDGQQIILQGSVRLPHKQLLPIFARIREVVGRGHQLGPAWRQLKDESWVFIIPGRHTASVVIYSLEPAIAQRQKAEDAHRDFERANEKNLTQEDIDPTKLVYPHRALLQS